MVTGISKVPYAQSRRSLTSHQSSTGFWELDESKFLIRVAATCIALFTSACVQFSQPWKNGKDTATALRPEMAPSSAAPTVPDDSTEPLQSALLQYMNLQLGCPGLWGIYSGPSVWCNINKWRQQVGIMRLGMQQSIARV